MKFGKILSIMLASAMIAGSLTGCGQSNEAEVDSQEKTPASSSSVAGSESSSEVESTDGPITTDPITIEILVPAINTTYEAVAGDEMWCFKYLEWWMNEQGYDITLEVTNLSDGDQLNLMLASGELPDLIWGPVLANGQAVTYGAQEGMLLDWTPYINEEYMPNLVALDKETPEALAASICVNGGVYSLPTYNARGWGYGAGNNIHYPTMMVNKNWLEACGIEKMPSTYEEFIDMLRTFKEKVTLEDGLEVIPYVPTANYLEPAIWAGLGYYGFNPATHGNFWAIKDEEVVYPVVTEDYRTYIETMKTMYDEGLISQDYLTMDDATARGIMSSGQCGVMSDSSLISAFPDTWSDWISLEPLTVGDNEKVAASVTANYSVGRVWASAETKYPEVLAYMLDYFYSEEGTVFYHYGPMKGTDPLELIDGWFINDEGTLTYDEVESGKYTSAEFYLGKYICPLEQIMNNQYTTYYAMDIAGVDSEMKADAWPDAIKGDTFDVVWLKNYTREDGDGYNRVEHAEKWMNNTTRIILPGVFMSEEEMVKSGDLAILLNEHINAESAKFITGVRPVSEIDAFWDELKALGVDEYIQLYKEAYSSYMETIFN